ncbi:hypothetical protein KTQ74_23980 [Pseudomonas chlororaphis]|nr:hypothetical protein [Pseudomonas chlororaphis]
MALNHLPFIVLHLPLMANAVPLTCPDGHDLDRDYGSTRAYLPRQDLASGPRRIIGEGRMEGMSSSKDSVCSSDCS